MLVRSWRNPFSSWQIRLVNSSVAFYCDCDFSFRRPFIPTNLFVIFFFGRIPQKKRIGFWGLVKRNHFWLWWIRNNSRVFAWVFNGMRQIAILVLVCFFFYCCCWETKMKFNSRWQIKWYFCTNYIFFNFGFKKKCSMTGITKWTWSSQGKNGRTIDANNKYSVKVRWAATTSRRATKGWHIRS